ncbi:MAG: hypothetical protein QOK15_2804 [Nocardioidaceae bacterium]|nr:hypothetical protein [Nocardioidaceae bacterium]
MSITLTPQKAIEHQAPIASAALRMGGLAAVIAGASYTVVGLFHPANVPSAVTGTRWEVVHLLACATSVFGLLGMAALCRRHARTIRWPGLVGYALLSLWLTLIMGFSFVEAFVLPHIASSSPGFVDSWMGMFNGGSSGGIDLAPLPTLWMLTAPIYMLGGLLFGIAVYRGGVLPRAAGVLLAIGTVAAPLAVLLPLSAQPKMAIPVGVALMWLGWAVWSAHGERLDEEAAPAV